MSDGEILWPDCVQENAELILALNYETTGDDCRGINPRRRDRGHRQSCVHRAAETEGGRRLPVVESGTDGRAFDSAHAVAPSRAGLHVLYA